MKRRNKITRAFSVGLGWGLATAVCWVAVCSSCTKPDNCKGVVCKNKGTCADGFCVCPSGVGGDTCQTIYRNFYDNKYAGTANVNTAHIGYTLIFSVPTTATNFLSMSLKVVKSASGLSDIPALPIALKPAANATKADFTVTAVTSGGFTYTGTGVLYAKQASLTLYKTPVAGADTTFICTDFIVVP